MIDDPKSETYTEAETAERAAATLKVMLATPHKPHKAKGKVQAKMTRPTNERVTPCD